MSRTIRLTPIIFLFALVAPLGAGPQESAEEYMKRGMAQYERGELDEAIASYRKAIELQPNKADAHINLGAALQQKGELDEAITSFRKAIELQPDLVRAHFNLGVALRWHGRWLRIEILLLRPNSMKLSN